MRERIGVDLQRFGHEALAFAGEFDGLFGLPHQALPGQAVEHLHAEIAGEVVVADACPPQRRILRPGAHAHVAGARCKASEPFQHAGHVGAGEAIVAVPALLLRLYQAAGLELGEMRARGLRRDAGFLRKLAGGERAAAEQRRQHVGAGGIADQRGNHGDIGAFFHSSMLTEVSIRSKPLCSRDHSIVCERTGRARPMTGSAKRSTSALVARWIASSLRSSQMTNHEQGEQFMPITVFIRYQIDPFKRAMFEEYARRWLIIIPKCGGDLIGYWMPHEGSNNIAFALISFESLAAYETYRARLRTEAESKANFDFAEANQLILAEERTFLRKVVA